MEYPGTGLYPSPSDPIVSALSSHPYLRSEIQTILNGKPRALEWSLGHLLLGSCLVRQSAIKSVLPLLGGSGSLSPPQPALHQFRKCEEPFHYGNGGAPLENTSEYRSVWKQIIPSFSK
ncbi:hypothetical protein TIFTF001_049273 [Ficus carica]|uniref:Uncharacterized protein n=1 Tax=Ficus carica TaxID=3494 RepID=A0AA88CQM6_FICCA|nr:hypothetical protein TIFTF001_049273 [Ficus carica]